MYKVFSNKYKMLWRVLLSLFILHAFYTVLSANAQTMRSITVSPPTIEYSLSPGEAFEGILKVINRGSNPLAFKITVRDYVVSDNAGTPKILPADFLSNKYSAASWIGVDPTTFTVSPGSYQEIDFFIQVPKDARPGGHYASVLYEPINLISFKGSGAGIVTQIGTLFYLHVKGQIEENARVIKFETSGFQEYGHVGLSTEILNTSDLHIKPRGKITLTNMLGQRVETQDIEEHNIFPEKTFLYKNKLGKRFMFGRYKASLLATYGLDNNKPLLVTTSFIVFPWKIATLAMLVLIIVVLGSIYLKQRKTPPIL